MERKRALGWAGAVTLATTAAVVAIGANLGLFGLTAQASGAGQLSPVAAATTAMPTTATPPVTIYLDEPPTTGPAASAAAPVAGTQPGPDSLSTPAGTAPVATPTVAPTGGAARTEYAAPRSGQADD